MYKFYHSIQHDIDIISSFPVKTKYQSKNIKYRCVGFSYLLLMLVELQNFVTKIKAPLFYTIFKTSKKRCFKLIK